MGAGASTGGVPVNAGSGSPPVPEFVVNSNGKDRQLPSQFYFRLEPESVAFAYLETREQFRHYPYYTIMCWGHTANTFQFRLYQPGSKVEAVSVSTKEGGKIENVILQVVKKLMSKMKSEGTSKEEFEQMLDILKKEEGDGDVCVDLVKKFFETHSLTINQTRDIMETIKFPCSFDKIAVAAASYNSLINKDTFSMILHLFDDYNDRLNLCHMLKLPEDMALGETVKPAPGKLPSSPKPSEAELMAPFKEEEGRGEGML